MPDKHSNTERIGGPGAAHEDRKHPEKFQDRKEPRPGEPTSGTTSKVSGGGGEREQHHSQDPRTKRSRNPKKWTPVFGRDHAPTISFGV
jgi:hypothetical protein